MKNVNPVVAFRSAQQHAHGRRVEERQRVNGQPNGYKPISDAEVRAQSFAAGGMGGEDFPSEDVMDQTDNISLQELQRLERNAWRA